MSNISDKFLQDAMKRIYRRAYHAQASKALNMAMKPSRATYRNYMQKGLALGAAGGAGLLAANAVLGGASKIMEAGASPKAFQRMLAANPDLKKLDKAKIAPVFDAYYKASPTLAKSPLVAGSLVRRTVEYGDVGLDPKTIADLTKAEAGIQQNKMGRISALSGIGKMLML